jgi:5-methylcytosine-specific restriction enzyme A
VAFPIVETYEIVGKPHARKVFAPDLFRRLYQSQSALLRPFDDEARKAIADLELIKVEAPNAWIAIEDEIAIAERSVIPRRTKVKIDEDLTNAMEGETEERRRKVRLRAAWLANRFAIERSKADRLVCDDCGFNPRKLPDGDRIPSRSCLDVHHLRPLEEEKRRTWFEDLSLLCPTCHRVAHLRLRHVQP